MFKIGTLSDWFGKGVIEGIKESHRCGAAGVQLYAWNEMDPRKLSAELKHAVKETAVDYNQEIVALCGELGGHGLSIAADNPGKIDYLKRVADLAAEFNCHVLTTHIGIIPSDENSEKYRVMRDACKAAAVYAAERGITIAIETGPEPIARLKTFIDNCNTGDNCNAGDKRNGSDKHNTGDSRVAGIGVNYDPANLVMVTRDDEVAGVRTAGKSIVHTHAKDGIMNHYAGPDVVYELFAQGGIEALSKVSEWFTETALGKGSVRWIPYLQALRGIGYNGYLTIEREVKDNATEDIRAAVSFLKEILPQIER
ncbi:MAG: sugar phosphate isomerase/epimerase [Treponema sp.]|nr:sugar phosphate isomerase/epimerase [Treponema sp.]